MSELGCVDRARVGVHGAGAGGWLAGQVRVIVTRASCVLTDSECVQVVVRDRRARQPLLRCAILQSPIADWALHGNNTRDTVISNLGRV